MSTELGGLLVCPTPIGNLEDVTLRVLRELAEADVVLCEDTRHTRKLLERHGVRARLLSYHQHNEAARTAELVPRLEAGERIALVSDAGLPGVSDPGARLVREWHGRTHTVTVTEDGFEYAGTNYPSLTKIAKKITGAHWSGLRFFGLVRAIAPHQRDGGDNG